MAEQLITEWQKQKSEIKHNWSKLTDEELENSKGNVKEIKSMIEKKYGTQNESFSDKINNIFKTKPTQSSAASMASTSSPSSNNNSNQNSNQKHDTTSAAKMT